MTFHQDTIKTYNKIAQHYNKTHFNSSFWKKEFKLFKSLISGNKIVDIGCGAGRDATLFLQNNFDYTGLDASSEMLKEARKRAPTGKFILGNFYQLDFPDETFDGFWAAASLLHAPKTDIESVLNEILRILKPGGVGFISLKETQNIDEGMIKEDKYGGIKRYFSFYTPKELGKILKKTGSVVIKNLIHKEGDTNWLCYFVKKL